MGTVLWTVGYVATSLASNHSKPVDPLSSCEVNMSPDTARCPLGGTISPVKNQWVRRMLSVSAFFKGWKTWLSLTQTPKGRLSSIPWRQIYFLQMQSWNISPIVYIKTTWRDFKNPFVQATPQLVKPELLGVGLGHRYFLKRSMWAQCTAKVENHWSSTCYSSVVFHWSEPPTAP